MGGDVPSHLAGDEAGNDGGGDTDEDDEGPEAAADDAARSGDAAGAGGGAAGNHAGSNLSFFSLRRYQLQQAAVRQQQQWMPVHMTQAEIDALVVPSVSEWFGVRVLTPDEVARTVAPAHSGYPNVLGSACPKATAAALAASRSDAAAAAETPIAAAATTQADSSSASASSSVASAAASSSSAMARAPVSSAAAGGLTANKWVQLDPSFWGRPASLLRQLLLIRSDAAQIVRIETRPLPCYMMIAGPGSVPLSPSLDRAHIQPPKVRRNATVANPPVSTLAASGGNAVLMAMFRGPHVSDATGAADAIALAGFKRSRAAAVAASSVAEANAEAVVSLGTGLAVDDDAEGSMPVRKQRNRRNSAAKAAAVVGGMYSFVAPAESSAASGAFGMGSGLAIDPLVGSLIGQSLIADEPYHDTGDVGFDEEPDISALLIPAVLPIAIDPELTAALSTGMDDLDCLSSDPASAAPSEMKGGRREAHSVLGVTSGSAEEAVDASAGSTSDASTSARALIASSPGVLESDTNPPSACHVGGFMPLVVRDVMDAQGGHTPVSGQGFSRLTLPLKMIKKGADATRSLVMVPEYTALLESRRMTAVSLGVELPREREMDLTRNIVELVKREVSLLQKILVKTVMIMRERELTEKEMKVATRKAIAEAAKTYKKLAAQEKLKAVHRVALAHTGPPPFEGAVVPRPAPQIVDVTPAIAWTKYMSRAVEDDWVRASAEDAAMAPYMDASAHKLAISGQRIDGRIINL
jgi:hypothetical protein